MLGSSWPGGATSDDTRPPIAIAVDRGSAWTVASVIGHVAGRWQIAAHVRQPTRWGDDELFASLAERLRHRVAPDVAASMDETLRAAPRIEAGSLRARPSLGVVSVPGSSHSAEVVEAAERAGWRVDAPDRERLPSAAHRFAAYRDLSVDAWLVVARAGRPGASVDTARLLVAAAASLEGVPILWAAPDPPGEDVERTLMGADLRYLPRPVGSRSIAGRLRPGAAAVAPRRGAPGSGAAGADAGAAPGLAESLAALLEDVAWASARPTSSAAGMRRAVEALARLADIRVLAVDIGAETSSWTLADGHRSSGVESDDAALGSPALSAPAVAADFVAALPFELDAARVADVLRTIAARPATLPEVPDELAIVSAAVRHCLGELLAPARPLRGIDLLIGSGRSLAAAPTPAAAAELLVEGARPLGITRLAVDLAGILPALGALGPDRLIEALTALGPGLLAPLGTAVISSGGTAGAEAMRIRVTREGRAPESVSLRYGQLEVLPLDTDESAELDIELEREISLGTPRRLRRVRARVTGGSVGLIFDARDVPIQVPRRAEDRRLVLADWHERFVREHHARRVTP